MNSKGVGQDLLEATVSNDAVVSIKNRHFQHEPDKSYLNMRK